MDEMLEVFDFEGLELLAVTSRGDDAGNAVIVNADYLGDEWSEKLWLKVMKPSGRGKTRDVLGLNLV